MSMRAIYPPRLVTFNLIITVIIGGGLKLWSFSLCNFPVLLLPQFWPKYSPTHLSSFLNAGVQISRPYKTADNITSLLWFQKSRVIRTTVLMPDNTGKTHQSFSSDIYCKADLIILTL